MAEESKPPRAFFSYSHDSPAHKQWVAELASRLRRDGVDSILDQWDLGPGHDVTKFMEQSLATTDRVLMICTEEYIRKADAGEGGVGYERMIVTAELVRNLGTDKFIPIVRQGGDEIRIPRFLGARFYVNLSGDEEFKENYEQLLRELHKVPPTTKPPLGKSPFATLPSGAEAPLISGRAIDLPKLPDVLANPSEIYSVAVELARLGDHLGWRQLVKKVRAPFEGSLLALRQYYECNQPKDDNDWQKVMDEAAEIMAPILGVALVGVESGREQFRDQRALLDIVLNVGRWPRGGLTRLVELPGSLVYICQAILGAMSLATNQLPVAMNLADMKLIEADNGKARPLRQRHDLIGWPTSLGGNCVSAWNYLTEVPERWAWLSEAFGGEREYRVALCAYYMALNIHELADTVSTGNTQQITQTTESLSLDVPLEWARMPEDITGPAISMLQRQPELSMLWSSLGVPENTMRSLWPHWVQHGKQWLANGGRRPWFRVRRLPHEGIFD